MGYRLIFFFFLFWGWFSSQVSFAKEPDLFRDSPTEILFFDFRVQAIEEGLQKNSQTIFPEDKIKAFPPPNLRLGFLLEIWRAPLIEVIDQGRKVTYRSWQEKVSDLLEEKKLVLGELDKISPFLTSAIQDGSKIEIIRVKETEVKIKEKIDFKTIEKDDPELEKGKTRVVQEGKSGLKTTTFLVRRENGREVSRKKTKEEITPPVDKLIAIGTKIKVLSSETGLASWTYGKTASRRYKKGTKIKVTNLQNGKSVETEVEGYGPLAYTGKILDLNIDLWEKIAPAGQGVTQVKVEELSG